MEHVGIDLGAKHSHVVVISEAGEVVARGKRKTAELPRWLARQELRCVVMEACTQSPAVAKAAVAAGHQTRVIPGVVVRALGVGARGIKTDWRDAEMLARASLRNEELPSVHSRSEESQSRRELLSARATLVEARKRIALSVKSWLRGRLLTLKGRANAPAFAAAVREIALEHEDGLPEAIEALLVTFEHLCAQIKELGEELEAIAAKDAVCCELMKIPGVGPQVALSFMTQIDDPKRFANAERLTSYLALVPGEATTGGKLKRTSTIKAGPSYLKARLVQAAWVMWRSRPNEPMVLWARTIAERRGKRIAIVALARKLAAVMWSMWRHGTSYDPARTAQAVEVTTEIQTMASSPPALED